MANFRLKDFENFPDTTGFKASLSEMLQFHVEKLISRNDFQFLQSATIEERNRFWSDIAGGLSYCMVAQVEGMKGKEEILASELVPATWMDHMKETLVSRFPWLDPIIGTIRRRKIETKIQHYSLCPHTHIPNRSDFNVHAHWMVENSASPGVADLHKIPIPDRETASELEILLHSHFITPYGDTRDRLQYAKNYLIRALDDFRAIPVPTPPIKPPEFGDEL